MGFCFTGGKRAICVTLSQGIILIRCFCTCFRCVERFGSSRRRKKLGTNNVSNHSLSFFRPRFCLSFLCSSPHSPSSPSSPCSPPHSCCPLGPRPDACWLGLPQMVWCGELWEAWKTGGAEQFALAELGAELQPEASRPRGWFCLEVPATSFFFWYWIQHPNPSRPSHSGHLMRQLCKLGWLQLWVFKYLETLLSFKKKRNEFDISLLWRQAGKTH